LNAALSAFVDVGYDQATVALIRERSGVSNGALFHHFPTKEAIADALYLEGMGSFQQGLWEVLARSPRSVRGAIKSTLSHLLEWVERNPDRARFIYARGHMDWQSPASAELDELNRETAARYREWMAPLLHAGELQPITMPMLTAIVTGPAHTIARRWLAGPRDQPLTINLDPLVDAATAAIRGTPSAQRRSTPTPSIGRLRVQLLSPDGSIVAEGEATAPLTKPE
jgi:AcrR family transcriptional regulator